MATTQRYKSKTRQRNRSTHRKSKAAIQVEQATLILHNVAKGSPFFESNPARKLPNFNISDVDTGAELGEGEFCSVKEVTHFLVEETCTCWQCRDDEESRRNATAMDLERGSHHSSIPGEIEARTCPMMSFEETDSQTSVENVMRKLGDGNRGQGPNNGAAKCEQTSETVGTGNDEEFDCTRTNDCLNDSSNGNDDSTNDEIEINALIGYMKVHCCRGLVGRYAVKKLKTELDDELRAEAGIDLAIEAKFLAVLSHPNIVKMRGTGGVPCHPQFFIVLDRLFGTLADKINEWNETRKKCRGFMGKFGKHKLELAQLWIDQVLAAYDIARAMRYLHQHKIMFRDLKPENIGFDVRGDAKIFDFGLAKELLVRDLVSEPDSYKASGMTGTRRYMAPEVALCKSYGLSSDVFSFSILFWEICSLKVPFDGYTPQMHSEKVVFKGKRPKIPTSWPVSFKHLLQEAWSSDPKERPSFQRICDLLGAELMGSGRTNFGNLLGMDGGIENRSNHLVSMSLHSRYGSLRRFQDDT